LSAFDIFAAAGAQHKAVAKSFNAAADTNGNISISLAGVPGLADVNAKVDGIQVLNVTAPPVAANEVGATAYNAPVNVNLATGATGNPTAAAIVGTPSGGTVTLNGLTATFTPNAGFSGTASFQFTLSNAGGTSNTASATITVGAPAAGQVEDFQYLSGDWYLPDLVLAATAGPSATGPNIIRCAPGGLRNKATISNIGARVFTADPAGHLQFAIYSNGANQRPANLVASSASMPAARL
jgi:Bacterial Ig domain